jgi:hypothetical protein
MEFVGFKLICSGNATEFTTHLEIRQYFTPNFFTHLLCNGVKILTFCIFYLNVVKHLCCPIFENNLEVRQYFTPNFFTHLLCNGVKILTFVFFTWMLLSTCVALFSKIIFEKNFVEREWGSRDKNIIYLQGVEIF